MCVYINKQKPGCLSVLALASWLHAGFLFFTNLAWAKAMLETSLYRAYASIRLICCTFPLECAVKRFTALIPTRSGFFLCFVEGACDPAWMRLLTILCLCSHHQTSGCVCCWVLVLKQRAIFKRRSTLLNSLEVYGCAIFKNSTSEISVDFSVHLEENSSLLYVKIAYMGRWFAQPDF